ncbi:uncharacterized protein NPIL_79181 [Nephila pilipes]|uniref:Avidin family protein n=1 Tax=Nephila pilipes TaxID=299642 RepID=A0A8X6TJQ8_NEPPI|nr:uncharacterized protein NPIL_79181 [Nephila pilipes]
MARSNPCSDLSGTWRNELGSNLTITHVPNSSFITGWYSTAVESSPNAASISSNITGIVHNFTKAENRSLVAFNVIWRNGSSLTSWVGECISCNGEEKIYTTWVLRTLKNRKDKWMSTLINEDTFWRVDRTSHTTPVSEDTITNSSIVGKWQSETGDCISITNVIKPKDLKGSHKSPTETNGSPIFGQFDGNGTYFAVALVNVDGDRITGWSGHIYNPLEKKPVMETSWLSYKFSNLCNNPRANVNYGMYNYTYITGIINRKENVSELKVIYDYKFG